jgi:hypothetical protein
MSEKTESGDGLPPPRLHTLPAGEAPPAAAGAGSKATPLSAQVKELTKELRAQLNETQKPLDRTRTR